MGWDARRIHPVVGDLAKPRLGLSAAQVRSLSGKVQHFFHLAAIYDLTADAESQRVANIEGTRHAIELASAIKAGCSTEGRRVGKVCVSTDTSRRSPSH